MRTTDEPGWPEVLEVAYKMKKSVPRPNRKYFEDSGYSEEQWREALGHWRQNDYRADALIKMAMLRDLGIADHPKADQLFNLAYDWGHSRGWRDVYFCLSELSDLLRD